MTRIIERHETGPLKISKAEIQGDAVWICRCGLSRSQPFCDGSHAMTRDEAPNVMFRYLRVDGTPRREAVDVHAVGGPEVPRSVAQAARKDPAAAEA